MIVEILQTIVLACTIQSGHLDPKYVMKLQRECQKKLISCTKPVVSFGRDSETRLVNCLKEI
jgi:hypothetical protein